jgi:hypothetical protein
MKRLMVGDTKRVTLLLLLLVCGVVAQAQYYSNKRFENKNNPNYDLRRKFTYGFQFGLHSSTYQVKYSDQFTSPAFDSVFSVEPEWRQGFILGFIVNYRVSDFLDIRLTPQVAFYEHSLSYVYVRTPNSLPTDVQIIESTMVEFPILAKYKSVRRGNLRMYMIGGVKPGFEASGRKKLETITDKLAVSEFNLGLEAGLGLDFYYPLFKFSPEIRFSKGLTNLLQDSESKYAQPLSRINTNTITLYLLFQ